MIACRLNGITKASQAVIIISQMKAFTVVLIIGEELRIADGV